MDETDLKIIEILKSNSRMSYSDIGRIIHMSSPAVKNRIDNLEESIIEKFTIQLKNNDKLESYILFKTSFCDKLSLFLNNHPLVIDFSRISGEYNYIAKIKYNYNSELENISKETSSFAFSIVMPILK